MNLSPIKCTDLFHESSWLDAYVDTIQQGRCQLDNGMAATISSGCLLQPEEGDHVLMYQSGEQCFITQVLQKKSTELARLNVQGVKQLLVDQPEISLMAHDTARITAVKDIELSAISGNLHVQANNFFSSIRDTVVEQARHKISKAFTYALDVTGLTRIHSEQTVMTAEKDLKIDAERISMG